MEDDRNKIMQPKTFKNKRVVAPLRVTLFQAILRTFVFFRKNPKKSTPGGQGGPPNLFYPKPYFLCDLNPHSKIRNPTITPSGRKVSGGEEKKTPLIVDT